MEQANTATADAIVGEPRADAERTFPPIPDDALIILPTRNLVLFPGLVMPINVGRETSVAAVQEAVRSKRRIGVVLQRDPATENPSPEQLHDVGTAAAIVRYLTTPDGTHHLVCQGQQRFRIVKFLDGYPFPVARVEFAHETDSITPEIEARMIQVKERAVEALQLIPQAPAELAVAVQEIKLPGVLADFIAGLMDIQPEEKQAVLATADSQKRLDTVLSHLVSRIEVLRLSREISDQTQERLSKSQRDMLLREQLKTIHEQLGENGEAGSEIAELAKAVDEAKMPEEIDQHARKELKRLERMQEGSGEYPMLRTYLEWLTELPWSKSTDDHIDIAKAREVLNDDHFGLDKIKRRILEYLAVRKLNPEGKSPILCFVGPPGWARPRSGKASPRPPDGSSCA